MRISPYEVVVARVRQLFRKKNRIHPDDKILATLLYHLGLSYRKVASAMETFSHESVRTWYRKIGLSLPKPKQIHRHLIAIDETKLKISGQMVFVWSCVDVKRYEALAIRVSAGRGAIDAILFIKEALKYCTNRPIVLVDHGPWYPPALEYLGLRYRQVTFGKRNIVESWFSILKHKTKRFYNDFPYRSTFQSVTSSQLICKDAKHHPYMLDNLTTPGIWDCNAIADNLTL